MSKLLQSTVLLEGITHIEDLPLKEFIRTVEAMKDKVVTEKLDGHNLWFGIDDKGFFTSREGKSPKRGRFYDVSDYPETANTNAFRAAHLALQKVESTVKQCLKPGDMVEMEVLFGRQPNTVTYGNEGKNYIVILRGVNETPNDRVQKLSAALNKKAVTVKSKVISSSDGSKLDSKEQSQVWQFTNVEPIDGKNINTSEALEIVAKMKEFINAKNESFPEMTNGEVAEMKLSAVSKDQQVEAKIQRDKVNAQIMKEFKLPIKELLLNHFVRKIKPFLQDTKLHPAEDIGVEGVVIRDPKTGDQTKIVDKDVFTTINSFNSAVRANISGLVRSADKEQPIEMRGGVFGQAKIDIANLLGAKELALSSGLKRYVSKFKGADSAETAANLAKNLNISSNISMLRTKISSALTKAVKDVDDILKSFKEEAGEFKLQLKTGKEIGISPEIMKRTLTAFAETKKEIAEVNSRVLKSRNGANLMMALYGKTIESFFEGGDEVKESLLKSVNETNEINEDKTGAFAAAKKVKCPLCGAEPGKACVSAAKVKDKFAKQGMALNTSHNERLRAAGFGSDKVKEDAGAGATSAGAAGGATSGGSIGPGFGTPSPAIGTGSSGTTTKAGNIAPYPFKLFGDKKLIKRRARNFVRPKKFPLPGNAKMGVPEEKFSLLKSINEETWGDQYMHFAGNDGIKDAPGANNDVEFNQLRNDVTIGNEVTPMDVNRYLNKAHEINDEVDTVTFGMEMDDGSVAKVYVNSSQADEFEKACAQLLGQETDIEQVVNDLANKFDIVDVEWPQEMMSQENPNNVAPGEADETPAGPEEVPVDGELPADETPAGPAGEEGAAPTDSDDGYIDFDAEGDGDEATPTEGGDEEFETDDSTADANDATDDGVERDDFGQPIGKKKKKKKKPESDEEAPAEEETTEESIKAVGKMIVEFEKQRKALTEAPATQSYANVAVQAISDMLVALGFDLNATRSFSYQAKQLIAHNDPGLIAAKQNSVAAKIKTARDALSQAMKVSAGQAVTAPATNTPNASTTVTQSFTLLGSIIAEEK